MTSNLCRWCGKRLQLVTTDDGRLVARQCPLCLDWAPAGQDVGRGVVAAHRGLSAALEERRARKATKAAKAARQGELFK